MEKKNQEKYCGLRTEILPWISSYEAFVRLGCGGMENPSVVRKWNGYVFPASTPESLDSRKKKFKQLMNLDFFFNLEAIFFLFFLKLHTHVDSLPSLGTRWPCLSLRRARNSSFSFTRFSPCFYFKPISIHWVCCRHEEQTDFEVNNHYFLISWDKGKKNPFSLPSETILCPCNHLCHFSELRPALPHLHMTSLSSQCP